MVANLALAVAVVAAAFSGLSWWTSRKSAVAAESSAKQSKRSADAADRSAGVAEREELLRVTEQRNAAALVRMELGYSGALVVGFTNGSTRPIRDLILVSVIGEHPDWRWTVNQRVTGARSQWTVLQPGETVDCPVEFITDHTVMTRTDGDSYHVVFEFTDTLGIRWRNRNGDVQVVRVPDGGGLGRET
jgi:hypothetical protein